MSRTRFNIFNAEEFDESVDLGGDAEVSATDSIEAETQAVEMEQDVAEVEEVMASTEEAEQVADELTEQVEEQEKVLEETPEEVTEDTVAVAQEAFFISMSKIGALKDYKDMRGSLGLESASSPAEKLKLACEGVWDFIKALIARIKIAISKVKELIKKLYIKFLVFFTNLIKRAKALGEELKKSDASKTINLSQDQIVRVTNTFKCFVAAGIMKSTKDLGKVVENISKVKTTLNEFVNDVKKIDSVNITARKDEMTKLGISSDANVIYAPYYVKSTMKALSVVTEDGQQVSKYVTLAIGNDGKIEGTSLSVGELRNVLTSVIRSERSLKDIIEAGKSAQETLDKALDEAEKKATEGKTGFINTERMQITNKLRIVRRAGTNVILDVVLNYIYNMKNVLAISAMIAKELNKK